WARLAVEKLNQCHTRADVELALQQLPDGMDAFYDRMAISISQNKSLIDRDLATTILQCVTCALRVLTVAELSEAIDKDPSEILDFQRSIVDLCGGFVLIDSGGNVSMIHQTAREYLLGHNDRPFHIDLHASHRQMFLSCMGCLMATGLRAKINRNHQPELLGYAATSWFSHLISTPLNCGQVVDALERFLSSSWVLTWIQLLAQNEQLRVLIRASKHLSRYSIKRRGYGSLQNEDANYIPRRELVENWAVDFVKIVGKFGTNLRRNPEAIYKLIAPFCPQHSSIYQLFGKTEARELDVSGLSTDNWDDLLARLSLGFNVYASSIVAAGAHIAIFASSGRVFIYDSSVFEEAVVSPIEHNERLYRMDLNSTGTLLATYGYRTTKVWELSTGKCKMSAANIESRPRPLTMLFTNNNAMLLVGTDDRRIRSLDLTRSNPSWQLIAELEEPELEGHFLNSSNHMALNRDGSLIAVAYRGHPLSAWETSGPTHLGHCWRNREEVARGEVIEAVWHPHSPEVLGLYIEGVVFKWRPYDGKSEEIATGASRLAINRDGSLFATGDVHGTVKVYTASDFGLLYQLASQDTVLGLAFSPNSSRFYDIRGSHGNVWEPNALIRFAEEGSKSNETDSETESLPQNTIVSMRWSRRVEAITTLSYSPKGRLYCCGTEKGTVHLHDTRREKPVDIHTSRSLLSIEQMSWSHDGEYLCFSDSSKKVFIMSIAASADDSDPVVETKAEVMVKTRTNGPILQLLFEPDSRHLLVHTSSTICTITLKSTSVTHTLDWHTAECKWITHPIAPGFIVGIGPDSLHVLDWELAEHQSFAFECLKDQDRSFDQDSSLLDRWAVEQVLFTHDKKHFLVQKSLLDQKSREKSFLYFETTAFSTSTGATPNANSERAPIVLQPVVLPQDLGSEIGTSLCFLPRGRLVFLSRNFSICTLQFPSGSRPFLPTSSLASRSTSSAMAATATASSTSPNGRFNSDTSNSALKSINELFSLPRDWISKDCLALCSIWSIERSLLCPRNGELAVVRCAALN
ncbi:MAG: hypothetical protein Q9160_000857, partial [Pyrenula sp. 1 TL-2023]